MLDSRQEAILYHARSALGTPWQHQGRLCHAGLDCIGLLCHVAQCIGMDYQDLTGYGRIPRPEVLIPALQKNLIVLTQDAAAAGDIILMSDKRTKRPMHLGILTDYGIIHANYECGMVVETVLDSNLVESIVGWFRFK